MCWDAGDAGGHHQSHKEVVQLGQQHTLMRLCGSVRGGRDNAWQSGMPGLGSAGACQAFMLCIGALLQPRSPACPTAEAEAGLNPFLKSLGPAGCWCPAAH